MAEDPGTGQAVQSPPADGSDATPELVRCPTPPR